ncbi:hypothetical protein AX16_008141 [Volvariella volvacea WC 439]|nr:hypothetical protein AX16_008141 [Volvariella volvacea WC 439]
MVTAWSDGIRLGWHSKDLKLTSGVMVLPLWPTTPDKPNPASQIPSPANPPAHHIHHSPISPTSVPPITIPPSSLPPPVTFPVATPSSSRTSAPSPLHHLSRQWDRIRAHFGPGSLPSGPSCTAELSVETPAPRGQLQGDRQHTDNDPGVDQVVVDRKWSEDLRGSANDFEWTPILEKARTVAPRHTTARGSHDSNGEEEQRDVSPLFLLVHWLWRNILEVFSPRFTEWNIEQKYMEENWRLKKSLAVWASIWLIANWVLGCSFVPKPFVLMDKIFYFGVAPALSFPIGLMVIFDWPRDRPMLYQTVLLFSAWCWPFYQILFMYLCGFYRGTPRLWDCSTRDFLGIFHYTTALPTIALFGLKLNRFPATLGATTFFVFSCTIMIPHRIQWTRTMINFAIFHIFLIYIHYMRENVRVPLNAAMIAVENIDAAKVMTKDQEYEFNALKESLSMMSKVLNDVLDFHRMDSGRLEVTPTPFPLHAMMRSLFMPLSLATKARGLQFITELDPAIDNVARRTAYAALGEKPEVIDAHIKEYPDVDGVVIADAPRIQQIVTNLASNACKFTPPGGTLTVRTRLIMPEEADATQASDTKSDKVNGKPDTRRSHKYDVYSEKTPERVEHTTRLRSGSVRRVHRRKSSRKLERKRVSFDKDNKSTTAEPSCKPEEALAPVSGPNWIVVRIEVKDTGSGIRRRDLEQNKLFSAFTQTEQGRQQGGKGTGLGLALVRQIVKLSGGRLGVRSQLGEGSLFWVELPVGIGRRAVEAVKHTQSESQGRRPNGDTHDDAPSNLVDAFSVRQAETTAPPPQSSPILRSLLEQGFIDYPLSQFSMGNDNYPPNPPDKRDTLAPTTDATIIQGSKTNPPDHAPPSHDRDSTYDASPSRTRKRVARPTYVPLPTRQAFMEESSVSSIPDKPLDSTNSTLYKFDSLYNRKGGPTTPKPTPIFSAGLPVLVVDDEPLTRNLMQRLLTRLGCRVTLAENGEAALKIILGPAAATILTPASEKSRNLDFATEPPVITPTEGTDFAVIFLDNQMPVMSGLTAVGKLRSLGRKDFVVGVTGNALLSDQQEYLAAGVNHVLTKPVLEVRLREVLALADARRKQPAASQPSTQAQEAIINTFEN